MQPELFKDLPTSPEPRNGHPSLFPHRYLRVRVAYEDLIFAALALLLVLLGGFCVGVERGRRLVSPPGHETRVTSQNVPAVAEPVLPVVPLRPAVALVQPSAARQSAPPGSGGVYAIQLASYIDSKVAQEEAQRLKRRGFDAQVIRQGKYYELRVVGFRIRNEALTALAVLKKTYQDGFVKRLSSG